MEADNVLADQVQISGPVLFVQLIMIAVAVIAKAGDIVAQSVNPDINNMVRIEVNRNTPLEGSAGNAQVLKTGSQEVVEHFVLSAFRLNEMRMILDILNQSVRVFGHFEEVGFLVHRNNIAAADRALAVFGQLALCIEGFALMAVKAFILALVDVALVIKSLEDLLNLLFMISVRRPDELFLDDGGNLVNELLRGLAGVLRSFLNLLAVFVCSGLETDIIAVVSLVAGNRIRQDDLIYVADMRFASRVGNRGCNVIWSFIFHRVLLL